MHDGHDASRRSLSTLGSFRNSDRAAPMVATVAAGGRLLWMPVARKLWCTVAIRLVARPSLESAGDRFVGQFLL